MPEQLQEHARQAEPAVNPVESVPLADFFSASAPRAAEDAPAPQAEPPAGYASKWRIEVRTPDNETANGEDFSVELLPELEPQTPSDAGNAPASSDNPVSLAAAVNPVGPLDVSKVEEEILPPPEELEPGTQPAPPPAETPVSAEEVAFSAPRMLEATATMSLPEFSDSHQAQAVVPPGSRPSPAVSSAEKTAPYEPEHYEAPHLERAMITGVVQRVMDRYKPLIVAEIVRELTKQQ
jgi:hypothetical protein